MPVLALGEELRLRLLVLVWAVSAVWFWLWWFSSARGALFSWRLAASAVLVWLFLNAAYGLFFLCRMTRPNPMVAMPDVRAAMVVTKAPSEPFSVLQTTLEAMLVQDFEGSYDVWLADERPETETLTWCAEHGVKVSTRHGAPGYQRPDWPRRARSKEGNLAYFYDTVGYREYDVVAQLDADHVPTSTYLREIVRPFIDPDVGYVAGPSVCDANHSTGWTVRGRLHKEASLHGPVQAGCNDGWAPVCIGSHYAVRTAALKEVGGLGPELAEDYSTTLWLQSGGWKGVFAIDAEAHGDGPESLSAMLLQEKQWARSLGIILTRWAPQRMGKTPWRARIRLSFALTHYLVQSIVFTLGAVLPVVAVLLHITWGSTSLLGFYGHLWPSSVVLIAISWYIRRRGVLRPTDARLWSTDLVLFQIVRWPWTAWGFARGMWLGWRAKVPGFVITAKGASASSDLAARSIFPTLLLGLVPAVVVVAISRPGTVAGMVLICALQASVYLSAVLLVIAKDLQRRRQLRPRHTQRAIIFRRTTALTAPAAKMANGVLLTGAGAVLGLALVNLRLLSWGL